MWQHALTLFDAAERNAPRANGKLYVNELIRMARR